jgi:hypothetical protein
MKKIILTFIILFFSINLFSQKEYDVRKVNWGMTLQEVISAEYPLQPIIDGEIIRFENVDIGNGFNSTLIYKFVNKRVMYLKYVVYMFNPELQQNTDRIVPLHQKVSMSSYVFEALKSKGYECRIGWHMNSMINQERIDLSGSLKNCNLNKDFVDLIDDFAKTKNEIDVYISFQNNRSNATFRFNEYQNSTSYETKSIKTKQIKFNYYNVFYWLEFKPNYETKKEMNKSRF